MKKVLFAIILMSVVFFACENKPKEHITLSGKVAFPDTTAMTIFRIEDQTRVYTDTIMLNEDGTYNYQMKVEKPGMYYFNCQKWQQVAFWADQEDLKIDWRGVDTAKVKIKNPPYVYINGGSNNEVLNHLNFNSYRDYQSMIHTGQTLYKNFQDDMDKYNVLFTSFNDFSYEANEARNKFLIAQYADRLSILSILEKFKKEKHDEFVNEHLNTLKKAHPTSQLLADFIQKRNDIREAVNRVKIGQVAPDFTFQTMEGDTVKLSDYRGNPVLVDFWASWCGPCVNEIPFLRAAKEKYTSDNLQVLSVSIDKNRDDWMKAIADHHVTWDNGLVPAQGREVKKLYQFGGIPFIILLDGEGKIIAKHLRSENIEKELVKLFDNN